MSFPLGHYYKDGEFICQMKLSGVRKQHFLMQFTKESLLYREIFEKYYPEQGEMIVDFWIANKSWEGCDVNNPSARVLTNYGDSGK